METTTGDGSHQGQMEWPQPRDHGEQLSCPHIAMEHGGGQTLVRTDIPTVTRLHSWMEEMEGVSGMEEMEGVSGMEEMEGVSGMEGMEEMEGVSWMEEMEGVSGMEGMEGVEPLRRTYLPQVVKVEVEVTNMTSDFPPSQHQAGDLQSLWWSEERIYSLVLLQCQEWPHPH